jgi:hypothetical protein
MSGKKLAVIVLAGVALIVPLTCENDESGGSKNRTCDLSIISAAL